MDSAPTPGTADGLAAPLRRTALRRSLITPLAASPPRGYPLNHPVARRWWSALLGPGAVADLLRLATAAQRGRSLPRPVHLEQLARHGLVRPTGSQVEVVMAFPIMPPAWLERLHPAIRRELRSSR